MHIGYISKTLFLRAARPLLIFLFLFVIGEGMFSEVSSRTTSVYKGEMNATVWVKWQPESFYFAKPIDYFITKHDNASLRKAILRFHVPSIMGKGLIPASGLAAFLEKNNPHISRNKATEIAKIYTEEAHHEGVNPDVAFSQMCLETGFLRYGGDVHPGQYNFCGLGAVKKGRRGLSFSSERLGIRAHIQHLKAYASTKKLNSPVVDSRFRFVARGSIKNIYDFNGRWASDKQYGQKMISLLKRLYQQNQL